MSAGAAAVPLQNTLPTFFINHGGGPMPLMGDPAHQPLVDHMREMAQQLGSSPAAILVVSAHWEESVVSVTSGDSNTLDYDYHGFPKEAYQYKYAAPTAPKLSQQISSLLTDAGVPCSVNAARGLDHGVFVPLLCMWPDASIPVIQLSLQSGLDPMVHLQMGRALQPLRAEGVLILASGMSFHNMDVFMRGASQKYRPQMAADFDSALADACCNRSGGEREALLSEWETFPHARTCHPREEHLIPLLVAAGAAGDDVGERTFSGSLMGAQVSSFAFGRTASVLNDRSEL